MDAEAITRHEETAGFDADRTKILVTATMGFLTDAYDLFIIGLVLVILKKQWGVTGGIEKLGASSVSLLTAAAGAWLFGRLADRYGRKGVYGWEMLVLAAGAIASAFSPNVWWLIGFRAILGFGIGGDYPTSSTIMCEYAGRRDRGKMVTLVFSAQGIGLVIGPLLAVILLAAGVPAHTTWRILLGAGAIPALSVFWLRRRISETPRFLLAQKRLAEAGGAAAEQRTRLFGNRKLLVWLLAISATWAFFDFAYYGDTIASSSIVTKIAASASPLQTSAIELGIFAVFSLPAFYLAAFTIDRIGHRSLQIVGFIGIAFFFALVWMIPGVGTSLVPFVILFGMTYFFSQFGPNTTTFVIASEIFPVDVRTTGNGIAAGVAKVGAFGGAALLPSLVSSTSITTMVLIPAGMCLAAAVISYALPEPAGVKLDNVVELSAGRHSQEAVALA